MATNMKSLAILALTCSALFSCTKDVVPLQQPVKNKLLFSGSDLQGVWLTDGSCATDWTWGWTPLYPRKIKFNNSNVEIYLSNYTIINPDSTKWDSIPFAKGSFLIYNIESEFYEKIGMTLSYDTVNFSFNAASNYVEYEFYLVHANGSQLNFIFKSCSTFKDSSSYLELICNPLKCTTTFLKE